MSNNNIFCDLGNLLILDTNPINDVQILEEQIQEKAIGNTKIFFEELYALLKKQQANDDEHRDFDKDVDNVKLPKGQLILPRARRIPKDKPQTKWEKFRTERGMAPRQRRSRMVYNETAKDWVPRWGKDSTKQIDEKANWVVEHKKGDDLKGDDPFTLKKREKKFQKAKQEKKEVKNKMTSKEKNEMRAAQKNNKLSNEKKVLNKTLEIAQKSTVTMGKFDRKIKNEPEIKKIKKKINLSTFDSKKEKERDKKILKAILEKNK